MELNEKDWPNIKAFIEKNISELNKELFDQRCILKATEKVAKVFVFDESYKTKIRNYQQRISELGLKLDEFHNAKDALLNYQIRQLEPFLASEMEILEFIHDSKNDFSSEDLNDN